MIPPGDRVLDWAASLFGDDVADRVFAPLVADWQHEWRAAPAGTARWRPWLSGWYAVLIAMLMSGATLAAPWRAERRLFWQSARIVTAFTIAGTAILIVPFLRYLEHPARGLILLGALLPSSLGLSLSSAILPLAMSCAGTGRTAARPRLFVIGVASLVVLWLIVLVGWAGPMANQPWRESVTGQPLTRGVRELTLPELWTSAGGPVASSAHLASELRTRLALMFAWPVALAILGWRLGRHRSRVSIAAMTVWWAFAALVVVLGEPVRHIARELPWLLLPCLWLLIAAVLRPRADPSLAASR